MNAVNRTEESSKWLADLRDLKARVKIIARVRQAEAGNFGDVKWVGEGVSERRIAFGPGYRVYCAREGVSSTCC